VVAGLVGSDVFADAVDADEIARAVAARQEGTATQRTIDMSLIDRKGRREDRVAIVHKERDPDVRLTRITFLEPKKYEDMTFLSHDRTAPEAADARWMYLPVNRRVRSIPSARRGDAFFGTDFSYEDMQSELKFKLEDWHFESGGQETTDGQTRYRLSGTPKTDRIARELGYGGFEAVIDGKTWMPVRVEFLDARSRPLKSIEVREIDRIDGIWTPVTNPQTGYCEYECHKCTKVCPTNAIQKLTLEEKKQFKMGIAVVDRNRCYTYADGYNCAVCEEHCPVPDKAIRFREVDTWNFEGQLVKVKQIYVVPDLCIGCGICENVCPRLDAPGIVNTSEEEQREAEY